MARGDCYRIDQLLSHTLDISAADYEEHRKTKREKSTSTGSFIY
jgi:hypothetical protein